MTASTSISTFHAGFSNALTTTVVLAGPDVVEVLAVDPAHGVEVGAVDEVDAGPHHVGERGPGRPRARRR